MRLSTCALVVVGAQPAVAGQADVDALDLAGGERDGGGAHFGEEHWSGWVAVSVFADLSEELDSQDSSDGGEAREDLVVERAARAVR